MDLNNKKRVRDGRSINIKYEIISYYEELEKNAKSKTVEHFFLKLLIMQF